MFFLMIATLSITLSIFAKPLLEKQIFRLFEQTSNTMVAELGRRIAKAETMAKALANIAEKAPKNDQLHIDLLKAVINDEGSETYIAGGGIWPEPLLYSPQKERRSFFWGRNQQEKLDFLDHYNAPSSIDYHQESWYTVGIDKEEGKTFWSSSYVDPYSSQPMVTCTVPMYRDNQFYGVATIDLKLKGLKDFFAQTSSEYEGYAFAVDQTGHLISFPLEDINQTPLQATGSHEDSKIKEFIHLNDFYKKLPAYQPINRALSVSISQQHNSSKQQKTAPSTLHQSHQGSNYIIDNDPVLKTKSVARIISMPDLGWNIVTVMPYKHVTFISDMVQHSVLITTLITLGFVALFIILLLESLLIRPIHRMTEQLKGPFLSRLDEPKNDSHYNELGLFAHWYNNRNDQLAMALDELQSARTQLEEQVELKTSDLLHAKEKAELATQAKSLFLANMSHELRTPMHAILSFSKLGMKKSSEENSLKINNYFMRIRESGDRLMNLLNDLLDFEKLNTNKMPIILEENDLFITIRKCTQEFEAYAAEKNISLVLNNIEFQTMISHDKNRITQVIANLISNAIKYSPNTSQVTINIKETTCNTKQTETETEASSTSALQVSVIDQGIGIPQEELQSVFDEFTQSSKTRSGTGGTGLGLAICKKIISAHNGFIWADNNPSGGSTLHFVIPQQTSVSTETSM